MSKFFNPQGQDFGTHPIVNDLVLPASPVTASSTVTYQFAAYRRLRRMRAIAIAGVTTAAGGGAITATVKKWDSSTSAYVPLTAAFDLTSLTSKVASDIPLLASLTEAQRIVKPGDTIAVDITAASTVTTQPTMLGLTAESTLLA